MMKVRRKSDGHIIGGWAAGQCLSFVIVAYSQRAFSSESLLPAAEYKGHAKEKSVKDILKADMDGMFARWTALLEEHACGARTVPEH